MQSDSFFEFDKYHTTVSREVIAGLTTFTTMADPAKDGGAYAFVAPVLCLLSLRLIDGDTNLRRQKVNQVAAQAHGPILHDSRDR